MGLLTFCCRLITADIELNKRISKPANHFFYFLFAISYSGKVFAEAKR